MNSIWYTPEIGQFRGFGFLFNPKNGGGVQLAPWAGNYGERTANDAAKAIRALAIAYYAEQAELTASRDDVSHSKGVVRMTVFGHSASKEIRGGELIEEVEYAPSAAEPKTKSPLKSFWSSRLMKDKRPFLAEVLDAKLRQQFGKVPRAWFPN